MKHLFFYSLIILFSVLPLKAQVTIGTNNKPHYGALLDLTGGQSDSGSNAVVSKGLGLPRVALEKIDQLFPMLKGDSDYENGTTKGDLDAKHIGLLVYNTSMCVDNNSANPQGLYVWDGLEWKLLTELESENVVIYKDQDNKDFKARLFGDAGIWMVENLAVTKFASAQGGASLPTTPSNAGSSGDPRWCYPGTNNLDPTLFNAQPELGLLYNWYAATNGKTHPGTDEGGTSEGARVQGICPDGWHLPSDKEWTDLENEIIKNTSKYSTMADIGSPLLEYDRPSGATTSPHGKAMKAQCMISGSQLPESYGASKPAYKGGFDAYLGGFSPSSQFYGQTSYFWTSSAYYAAVTPNTNSAWNRKINAVNGAGNPENYISRTGMGRQFLTAIRCKKDTNTP
ncbi:FISUMP domain-containing protein [Dysgonomonas sp. ZJ279]|uniref:FISUMP domain-containing protein n=1 Tax=Dysgonomonas sp. ZJ279 TaxID=2709796 RepID=UPI0013EB25FD|nr:FISUMP domain-containing protein [Dysgonomonas sp. ZJ279]